MYINVISFKNGKTIPFQSVVPYSVDKVVEGWNLVTDEVNGQILSFRGSEIVTIASQDVEKAKSYQKHGSKMADLSRKPALKTAVTKG